MDDSIWFVVAGVAIVGATLFKLIKHRGMKGAMFGAQLVGTVGEMTANARPFEAFSVKVHRLKPPDPNGGPCIGIEIDSSSFLGGSWEVPPIVLTRAQAKRLSHLLAKAAE